MRSSACKLRERLRALRRGGLRARWRYRRRSRGALVFGARARRCDAEILRLARRAGRRAHRWGRACREKDWLRRAMAGSLIRRTVTPFSGKFQARGGRARRTRLSGCDGHCDATLAVDDHRRKYFAWNCLGLQRVRFQEGFHWALEGRYFVALVFLNGDARRAPSAVEDDPTPCAAADS